MLIILLTWMNASGEPLYKSDYVVEQEYKNVNELENTRNILGKINEDIAKIRHLQLVISLMLMISVNS